MISIADIATDKNYAIVARLIHWLQEHRAAQPTLEQLAAVACLSPQHLQRVFSDWAGISPKRFLQVLNRDFLLHQLQQGTPLLQMAENAGLSTGSRVHDVFVTLEAMSPGEYRAGGGGIDLHWGVHVTPFGQCMVVNSERGICAMAFVDAANGVEQELANLQQRWPDARWQHQPDTAAALLAALSGRRSPAPVRLALKGTNFQIKIWEALLRIPEGQVMTYQGLAAHIGRPSAARAVGSAVAANPVAWLIPCHRIIKGTGLAGQYRWGSERKAAMLAWENAAGKPSMQEAC